MSRINIAILVVYLLLIAVLVGGLFLARSRVLGRFGAEASRNDWEVWRQEAARQSEGQGPVARRIPKATEAPTLLLLRDHFPACLTLALLISTVLFLTMAFLIRGVLMGPKLDFQQDDKPRS